MPWAYCKNSRRGREREPAATPRPVRQRLALWIVSHHAPPPPQQTPNEGCEKQKWGGGVLEGGALHLKRLSSCKLERHYLLTWRCPLWGCTLWCENRERDIQKRRKKRKKKNEWRKRSAGCGSTSNSGDKKIVCWHGFETLSVVSLFLKNNKWCTFDIMKMFNSTFIREYWIVFII